MTLARTGLTRRTFLATSAATAATACAALPEQSQARYIDGLSFLPEDTSQIAAAKLSAMICDVSQVEEIRDKDNIPRYLRTFETNDKAIDAAAARLESTPFAYLALRGSDIGSKPGCATFLQFQSCEPIGNDLSRIGRFHNKGLRVLQFTHHNNNLFAGGALERIQSGLTPLGREGLAEMNRLRMLPDVSHGSEATMLEAAKASLTPIVYSHGACRAIVDNPRCIPDAAIRTIADGGGVVGIFMMSFWLTLENPPTAEHFVGHIRHVIKVGGIDAAAIANDYPMAGQSNLVKLGNNNVEGVKEYLPWWMAMRDSGIPGFEMPPQHVVIPAFNTIERMPHIHAELDRAGFRAREVDRIMGANWKRVLSDVLG